MIIKYPSDKKFDHTLAAGPAESVAQAINRSLKANQSNGDQIDPTEHIPTQDLRRSSRYPQSRKPAPSEEILATSRNPPGGNKGHPKPSMGKLLEVVSVDIPLYFLAD